MREVKHTQLRSVSAKKMETIEDYVHNLPYKIELKSLVVFKKRLMQSFVLPDDLLKEVPSGDLD